MLFKSRFHEGIRNGTIRLTFRTWKTERVKVGHRYRVGAGAVEVEAIESAPISLITDHDAQRAGFTDANELRTFLRKRSPRTGSEDAQVFRVSFHYVGDYHDPVVALQEDTSPDALAEVSAKLHQMDRRSRHGPWTKQVLQLIRHNPQTAASRLAPELKRETRAFKTDVRKLKGLGLTKSFEVGYELTPRGRAVLKNL